MFVDFDKNKVIRCHLLTSAYIESCDVFETREKTAYVILSFELVSFDPTTENKIRM